jgi:rSAM/selenodomain-associated transferase 1
MATDRVSADRVPVAVMARAPVAGRAKTRLAPLLGAAGAARAHRQLLLRTLQTVQRRGLPLQLWCEPSARHRFFRALARVSACTALDQPAGDLGQRMHAAFAAHARHSNAPLLLIGTDCPALDPQHLRQAAQRLLDTDEAVFTPTEDGGYVLVGLRRPQPALFEAIDWGTDQVMAQTRTRLTQLGLRCSEMPVLWDVDEPADWQRWLSIKPAPI